MLIPSLIHCFSEHVNQRLTLSLKFSESLKSQHHGLLIMMIPSFIMIVLFYFALELKTELYRTKDTLVKSPLTHLGPFNSQNVHVRLI